MFGRSVVSSSQTIASARSARLFTVASPRSLSSALRERIGGFGSQKTATFHHLQRNPKRQVHSFRPLSTTAVRSNMGAVSNGRVETADRVSKLRELLKKQGVDAYVVPSEDEHASEYPAEGDLRRAYISGFSGSAGCAIISQDEAALFTDGRYFLQAGQQLDPKVWTLMKQGEPQVPTWQEYLSKNLKPNSKIGIDPSLIGIDDAQSIATDLEKVKSTLVPIQDNLVDQIWQGRPQRPTEPVFLLDEKFTGRSAVSKIQELRSELKKKGESVEGVVLNMLDEVAWLLNLRGSDVPYNPVFFAFALVLHDKTVLYINEKQLESEARQYVSRDVALRPYETFYDDLKQLGQSLSKGKKILVGKRASLAVREALGGPEKVLVDRPIVVDLKSIKNETEIQGFRDSHIRDGAALARYFAWLEEQLHNGVSVDEFSAAEELDKFRAKQDMYRGPSFTTISSTGPNGAIIHYSPNPSSCPAIDPKQIYLCDSGAQFTDGTTDVTRTWHFGQPSADEIRAFTRVLQGHIAIDRAVFASGTTGYQLDSLARRPLWEDGLDFRHGVGHGVGHFLNVHEPPQGISTRAVHNETSLKNGMVISNEPGYYKDEQWGIRIENLVVVRKASTPNNFGNKGYLCFEHLTFCPMQVSLIDPNLLDAAEKRWINDYHDETLAKVGPLLQKQGDERAYAWLKKHCTPRL